MIEENWRPVIGFEECYLVSNKGRVKSISRKVKNRNGYANTREHIMNASLDSHGYFQVNLHDSRFKKKRMSKVHSLVMESFIGPRPKDLVINHKDGVKTNNCLENLEYCTRSYNQKHSYAIGLSKVNLDHLRGENHPGSKLTEPQVREIFRLSHEVGISNRQLSFKFSINHITVANIVHRRSWKHLNL